MSVDDDFLEDDDEESSEGGLEGEAGSAAGGRTGLKDWFKGRRGWLAIIFLAIVQAIFATIMILLRSDAKPVAVTEAAAIKDLAVEMLGREIQIEQIHQMIPAPGGRRMTIGLDMVLVLGQLPDEQIEGAPKPNPQEMEMVMAAITDLEPRIRSRVNSLLQQVPIEEYGRVEVLNNIKESVKNYVNDTLEGLDFGKNYREEISKRRVTDVLLPMFVRQFL
ncbi:MAG: hypothetical protein LIP23_04100 [Planctomycetes bacterium]|nr:hypothetical protein [Planctomycetota bacterium]